MWISSDIEAQNWYDVPFAIFGFSSVSKIKPIDQYLVMIGVNSETNKDLIIVLDLEEKRSIGF